MISAQSLLQPLSGSKMILLLFILLFGCSPKRATTVIIPSKDPEPPVVHTPTKPTKPPVKIDTIQFKIDTSITQYKSTIPPTPPSNQDPKPTDPLPPPSTQTRNMSFMNSDTVDLVYLLNFGDPNFKSFESRWSVNFYTGVLSAFQDLPKTQFPYVKAHFWNLDNQTQPVVSRISSFNSKRPLVFIGSLNAQEANELSTHIQKKENAIYISPYVTSSKVTNNNLTYFQMNASLATHQQAIARRIQSRAMDTLFIIKPTDADENITKNILDQCVGIAKKTYLYKDSITQRMQDSIETRTTYHILVPVKSEKTVEAILSALFKFKGSNKVYVYGLPHWKDFSIDPMLVDALNVNITANYFIDDRSTIFKDFRRSYFLDFGTLPTNEVFWGYDLTKFIVSNYYTLFTMHDNQILENQLSFGSKVNIVKNKNNYFENTFINVFEYRGGDFKPVRD